jgi:hypothetical protein
MGVTSQEAMAQKLAFERADNKVIRIQEVYHFIQISHPRLPAVGYLVMEEIKGESLEDIQWKDLLPRNIAAAINAINSTSIRHTPPDPVGGGKAQGSLWSENGASTTFDHVHDLENYLNK